MTNKTTIEASFNTLVKKFNHHSLRGTHLYLEEDVAIRFLGNSGKRVVCTIDNLKPFHAAIMPSGNHYYFIMLNKPYCKEHDLQEGKKVSIHLISDLSEYGLEMPEMLDIVFQEDVEAFEIFKQLSSGKQTTLIHLVGKVKNKDSQMKKSLAIAHHLREVKTRIDFKRLNDTIKYYNHLEL